ncbi:MAG: ASKHA domain-containing protein [Eubacteriales bacterium]|nr:ASKHA domain-containing protein [Eubacteriales bacterium]
MNCRLRIHTDSGLYNEIQTEVGIKLIDAINTDHGLNAPCGGRGTCGKCRVRALGGLSQPTETELGLLMPEELAEGVRLACMTYVEDDAEVWLSSERAQILTGGVEDAPIECRPSLFVERIVPETASLEDQRDDLTRILEAARMPKDSACPLEVLRKIPEIMQKNDGEIWLVRDAQSGALVDLCAEEPALYGAAIDIGTTTVAAYLMDLKTGKTIASQSAMNPQRAYGADVISRIDFSRTNSGLKELQRAIAEQISSLIEKMLSETGAMRADVRHIMCVGNTVMAHLLLGVSPENIAVSPFVPVFTGRQKVPARQLGMQFVNAFVEIGPCVAGYIGADTTAAALACAMDKSEGTSLLIDIGTNGEIALGGKAGIVCCSAAAGPAFEGAHIRCGSGAVEGAISKVRLHEDGSVELETIGRRPPVSICGSGLIDVVAEMLRTGIIDETGRIDEDEADEIWQERIFDSAAGLAFALTEDRKVFICQKDIREVQLAKGAIAAGIQILLKNTKVCFENVTKLFLAGGFGNYIDVHNACLIGLLPPELEQCAEPVGNAAGTGARRMLLSTTACSRCDEMARNMQYIELSSQREFTELFSENMLFEI